MSFVYTKRAVAAVIHRHTVRQFHRSVRPSYKVSVVGAAGGIGQPLSLLLKQNKLVTELALYDVSPATAGIAADLSHIDTPAKVTWFVSNPTEQLADALKGADVIVVPAGVPRKPGMTRDDLFSVNAGIVANIAETAAKSAPKAALLIISNPVNSTVPIVAEVLKKHRVYDKNKLFGVTTLDVTRANTFVAENQKMDVSSLKVPVIGGHAGITILPLLSQVPGANFSKEDRDALTHRIQFGGDEVVKAKGGAGSATLSMAYAGARFTDSVLRGLKGESNIVECAFVESTVIPGVQFFATKVTLGKNGIEKIHPPGELSEYEKGKLDEALGELKQSIAKGVEYVKNKQ